MPSSKLLSVLKAITLALDIVHNIDLSSLKMYKLEYEDKLWLMKILIK